MKKAEFLSIQEAVKNGFFRVSPHSYGTSSAGYLTNYEMIITSKEHEKTFGRVVYYVCFSSKSWYKVKKEGRFYNRHYLEKYRQYDIDIEAGLYGSPEKLADLLTL